MPVGYNFAHLLFKQEGTEMLKVDTSLANDVVEQSFLGGEKLTDSEDIRVLESATTDLWEQDHEMPLGTNKR